MWLNTAVHKEYGKADCVCGSIPTVTVHRLQFGENLGMDIYMYYRIAGNFRGVVEHWTTNK